MSFQTASTIGYMPMPPGFPYEEVFRRGRPKHGIPGRYATYDAFYLKHPPMTSARRAKIFAPFDALRGFNDAINAKKITYEDRRVLTEGEKEALDRRLASLQQRVNGHKTAGGPPVLVNVTCFQPCEDPENSAFQIKGNYKTITGTLLKTDPRHRQIILDCGSIAVEDIIQIEPQQAEYSDLDLYA